MQEKLRRMPPTYGELAAPPPPPMVADHTLEQAIGIQVRQHRKASGLTVAELALAARISSGMLSKIENGQISASLTTLQTLSAALNIPMTLLFSQYDQRRNCSFVKSGEGPVIRRRGTKAGHQYQLLGHSLEGDIVIEPYLITLSNDAMAYTRFQHHGFEFIYMLTGEVEYAYGDQSFRLSSGDSILFDGAAPHGPSELLKAPACYISVNIHQKR